MLNNNGVDEFKVKYDTIIKDWIDNWSIIYNTVVDYFSIYENNPNKTMTNSDFNYYAGLIISLKTISPQGYYSKACALSNRLQEYYSR